MSKTYRFRTKDNKLNRFIRHAYFMPSARRSKDDAEKKLKTMKVNYQKDGRPFYSSFLTAPHCYRNIENRSKRMSDKQKINRNFHRDYDDWDGVEFDPRKNNATWNWC